MKRGMFVPGLPTAVCAQEPPVFEAASVKIAAVAGRCRRSNVVRLFLMILLPLFALPLLLHLPAMAQNGPPKDFQFEVLSIRPVDASPYGTPRFGSTNPEPNGFRSVLSVYQMLMVAYGPVNSSDWGSVEVLKGPSWQGQFYDIAAKVSQADLRAWQHQGPGHELLRAAMRAALRVRCKLAIHEQPSKGDIFELVVAKGGARLKPTAPANDPRPPGRTEKDRPDGGGMVQTMENGRPEKIFYDKRPGGPFMVRAVENGRQVRTLYENLPGGGVVRDREEGSVRESSENGGQVRTHYNATMKDLADFLTIVAGGRIPVRDKTGLTSRYDFTIKSLPRDPDENGVYRYPLRRLGLEIKPGTEQRPALVIDHIERPSPN